MSTSRHKFGILICIGIVSSLVLYGYQLYLDNEEFYNPVTGGFNYFLEAEEHAKLGYVVDTTNCRILNISAWDKSLISVISSYLTPPVDCNAQKKKWTYVKDDNLILNVTNLAEFGFKIDSIDCCYTTITRVSQDLYNFDKNADTKIKMSEECKPLRNEITHISTSEFIRVRCKGKYFPYTSDVLYRQFHAVALPLKNDKVKSKSDYWKQLHNNSKSSSSSSSSHMNNHHTPPNIVIIGIDSLSRLGFRRNMQMTKTILEEIGAVEMFGYTKVGENTFPNSVAFLSGYFETELQDVCYFTRETPQDSCPYIWKEFDKANYFTAVVEDAPLIGGFNYLKTGFVQQPVDYYFRPLMLALHEAGLTFTYILDCIGYRTVDEMILQYISDLLKASNQLSTPLFLYSWLTNMAHNDVNAARFGDETYANFIRNTDLNNTILFFMSDHGYRYGKVRQTFAGWYEDKLPNFWVYLPAGLKQKYSQWNSSLHLNSNRLTSPLDLYKTMKHMLEEFTPVKEFPPSKTKSGKELRRRFGQSFFKEIPFDRSCDDAGIASSFCACIVPRMLSSNSTELKIAAEASIRHINRLIPEACTNLTLHSISGGAVLEQKETKYVVDFYAVPGNFLFEATATLLPNRTSFDVNSFAVDKEILRMNKISTDVSCVSDGVIERYCYCDHLKRRG